MLFMLFRKKQLIKLTDEEDLMLLYKKLKRLESKLLRRRKPSERLAKEYNSWVNTYVMVSACYNQEPIKEISIQ